MWQTLRKIGIAIRNWFVSAANTDAINEANVADGIRKSKERATVANLNNGKLKSTIIRLQDQVKQQENKRSEYQSYIDAAISQNNNELGSKYASALADLEGELNENKQQLAELDSTYQENVKIIAESIREITRYQAEFEKVKAQVAISRSLEGLSDQMAASLTELQGMAGGQMGSSMQALREAASAGKGRISAVKDVAAALGSDINVKQAAREARGKQLFEEMKAKKLAAQSQDSQAATQAAPTTENRQKVAV